MRKRDILYNEKKGGVDVSVLIAVSTDYAVCEQELSVYRREKAARWSKQEDRRRCLCAGVALDKALQTIGLREKDAVLAFNEHGKPYLKDYPAWHFSLSHSGSFAVCVLSNAPVGVDVQQIRPMNYQALADRYFPEQEATLLRESDEARRQALFFRFWTEKESLLKMHGVGLSGLSAYQKAEDCCFGYYPLEGYTLTVCTTGTLPTEVTIIK